MQAQAYEGYFENGQFHTAGQTIFIPERRRVFITIFEELSAQSSTNLRQLNAETIEAILEGERMINDPDTKYFRNVDELFEDLNDDDE